MITDNSPLCCCEYLDIHEERNHILACCCNCQDFDEGFESFISGRGVPHYNQTGFMATLHDRLRIPWKGGAKRIPLEAVVSIILVVFFLLLASEGPIWTAVSGLSMIIFLVYVKQKFQNSRSSFFQVWMYVSFLVLYLIFEFIVIPFLEILWEENVVLTAVIAISCVWFWLAKKRRPLEGSTRNCLHCMMQVPSESKHCAWLNCCIGPHNSWQYSLGLLGAIIALLYGCNLTLTTVCHPFTWFASILLPDDCTDAYDLFELSLPFVSAVYGLGITIYFFVQLACQALVLYTACAKSREDKKIRDNFIA